MFCYKIEPRFCETDALGHINHTVVPTWLEQARAPIFKLFNPDLTLEKWNLILKKISVDYKSQIYLKPIVEIKTYVGEIHQTSFIVKHEVWQNEIMAAIAEIVLIHFDYTKQVKEDIPPAIKEQLIGMQNSEPTNKN